MLVIRLKIATKLVMEVLKKGFIKSLKIKITTININKIKSLKKLSHGVNFNASPKQPQSLTLSK